MNVATSNSLPSNWSAAPVVASRFLRGKTEEGVPITAGGQDGGLFWVREDTFLGIADTGERAPLYRLQWGTANSPWLFVAVADTPEHLDALLAAFVAAANTAVSP